MADLSTDARNKLKSSSFGLPGSRKYPMPDRAHAANAKARATQMVKKGKLSPAAAAKIKAKANRKLGKRPGGVDADLNAPTVPGRRGTTRYEGSEGAANNRDPRTPFQEDENNWKSRPDSQRGKWQNNSQGTGRGDDSGEGTDVRKQAKFGGTKADSADKKAAPKKGGTQAEGEDYRGERKFGGTQVASKNYRSQAKVQGATQADGKSYRGQPKVQGATQETGKDYSKEGKEGGTAVRSDVPTKGGPRRYTNSPDHDGGLRSMIRDH